MSLNRFPARLWSANLCTSSGTATGTHRELVTSISHAVFARSIPTVVFIRQPEESQSYRHISNDFSYDCLPNHIARAHLSGGVVRFRTMRSVRTHAIRFLHALVFEAELDQAADDIVPINCEHPDVAYLFWRVNRMTLEGK